MIYYCKWEIISFLYHASFESLYYATAILPATDSYGWVPQFHHLIMSLCTKFQGKNTIPEWHVSLLTATVSAPRLPFCSRSALTPSSTRHHIHAGQPLCWNPALCHLYKRGKKHNHYVNWTSTVKEAGRRWGGSPCSSSPS